MSAGKESADQRYLSAVKFVMGDVRGRHFIYKRLMANGLFGGPGAEANALQAAHVNGARASTIVEWQQLGKYCPVQRAMMLQENMEGFVDE
jgi:hypothetical protein